ncbi:universal stress protein [Aquibacillus sediminis]|uniref:universal stress protein n=1 Tax=Aquibacillus sediminis TaxID=2574734 RepID=UPI001108C15A|nr:universal stress protein [Aquibacillus sediminis]
MVLAYNNIVVAVDGSDASKRAFDKAIEIAKRNDARLILAHVIDTRTFASVEAYDRTLADRSEMNANQFMDAYKQEANNAGLTNIEIHIEFGSPKVKIPRDIAKEFNADLIICGATGINAVERFIIGSVSESITRYASCDVLVVRNH